MKKLTAAAKLALSRGKNTKNAKMIKARRRRGAPTPTPTPTAPDYTQTYSQPDSKVYRELAIREHKLRAEYIERSKLAYVEGDGATAKHLSEMGKQHGMNMEEYNEMAAVIVYSMNNVNSQTYEIDLHGLFVKGRPS